MYVIDMHWQLSVINLHFNQVLIIIQRSILRNSPKQAFFIVSKNIHLYNVLPSALFLK